VASFGIELRRLREESGLSLEQLSQKIHYSKGHISKIENGRAQPSPQFVRQCQAVLAASGSLSATVAPPVPDPVMAQAFASNEVWTMHLSPEGHYEFGPQPANDFRFGGSSGLSSWLHGPTPTGGDDAAALRTYRSIFDNLRSLGQIDGPSALVPVLTTLTHTLQTKAKEARPPYRREFLMLAARFAEYTGWMAQEKGDDRLALWWTDHAVELAAAGGDDQMLAYAFVRRALIALYRPDPKRTVELSRRAQEISCHPRILGLAAQREAQGHAIAGDDAACQRLLDRAAHLLNLSRREGLDGAPLLGTSAVVDPVAMSTGWCLYELGRSRQAAEVLTRELARVPERAQRARARYSARLALALASERELDQACAVLESILDAVPAIDSATIRADIGRVTRTLNRWSKEPQVRAIMPKLHQALQVG
jgi:transcriptional regulator with XRE-family HTH domain